MTAGVIEHGSGTPDEDEAIERLPRHPIGTLVIVAIYGVLFAAGWLLLYFGAFHGRGAPRP